MNRFEESKHPRDNDGKFTNKSGGNSEAGEAKRIFELAEKYGIEYNKDTSYQTVKARVEQAEKKSFINVQLFAPGLKDQSPKELQKSIKSHEKVIALHQYKIAHPELYIDDYKSAREEDIRHTVEYWKKEISNHQNMLEKAKKYLEEKNGK